MKTSVIRPDESEEFFTEERCHILELLNDSSDRSQSIARARVEPGITTAWHRLNDTQEIYYILSGIGMMEFGDEEVESISAGNLVRIEKNTAQRISNIGEEDLVFLCFCLPAFGPESYVDLE